MRKPPAPVQPVVYRCPKCDGVGKPYHVTTRVGVVELHFRCPYCQHEWTATKPEERRTPKRGE